MNEEKNPFEVGDVVRSTGQGEVLYVGETETRIRITEHPDPSVVGRNYSAPHSHFQKIEPTAVQPSGFQEADLKPDLGKCWFCKKGAEDENLFYDGELETEVHISCIKRGLESGNPEAKHMEYLIAVVENPEELDKKRSGFFSRVFGVFKKGN